ncbi:TIGR03621 family F420-dependent LLM class oxidoreductase [Amycolatopsis sp. WGS_07]|uniref:TIGR03621 family F420-dependent LLM class oxidoreductase n=1 Tax=Amycolatopsis sp. WGS_07 TaxID=3076764 RepID=UPI003873B8C3
MDGEKTFRFGVNLVRPGSRDEWVAKCRRVEELGYDVLSVADHLGIAPPFPALVLAGAVTERVRLNTFVLNAPFYNPVLLAREVAGTDQFVSGRLELGLGAGYVKEEFEAAGMPFPGARARVDHLEFTIKELQRLYADPEYAPKPVQPGGPPLMIAGRGDRLLSLAAEHAATIAFSGVAKVRDGAPPMLATADAVEERVQFVTERLDGRDAEFNVLVQLVQITDDRESALREILARFGDMLTLEELAEVPTVLVGTVEEIAEQLVAHRARFGFSYYTILEPNLEVLAPVVDLLCRR